LRDRVYPLEAHRLLPVGPLGDGGAGEGERGRNWFAASTQRRDRL